jgi:hypothetical protein
VIYLKSVLAGIAAVFAASILTLFGIAAYLLIAYRSSGSVVIGWDPTAVAKPLPWFLLVGTFLAGFFWEFRRVSSKRSGKPARSGGRRERRG